MNSDSNYNSCSIEEEDTDQFDKMAKKAKLSIVKSELEIGSLVLAKMAGYCRFVFAGKLPFLH